MNRNYSIMAALGFECVGLITTLMWLGGELDEKYQWNGFGSIGGAIVGLVAWVAHVTAVLIKLAKDEESSDTNQQ